MKNKMGNKWVKRILIILAVVVGVIFFGSIVFTLLGYLSDLLSVLMSWIGTAFKFLGRLIDIFGFTSVFGAQADSQVVSGTIEVAKLMVKSI